MENIFFRRKTYFWLHLDVIGELERARKNGEKCHFDDAAVSTHFTLSLQILPPGAHSHVVDKGKIAAVIHTNTVK